MQESSQKAWHDSLFQNVCIEPCISRGPSSLPWCTALKYSYTVLYIYIYTFLFQSPIKPGKEATFGFMDQVFCLYGGRGANPRPNRHFILYLFLYLLFFCTAIFGYKCFVVYRDLLPQSKGEQRKRFFLSYLV